MLDVEMAKEYFCYDPTERFLIWKKRKGRAERGDPVGSICDGYRATKFCGKTYRVHRMIWMMYFGEIEDGVEIDHRDGDRENNSLSNLRLATKFENMRNTPRRVNNKSGVKGVNWNKNHGKYQVQLWHEGKKIHGGYFADLETAEQTVRELRESIHGEYTRHR